MNLPKIDISSLPDLQTLTGVFGSLMHKAPAVAPDDGGIYLMTFVYDLIIRP